MERRLLLAIVLTFVVLTAYQWLVPTPRRPTPAASTGLRHVRRRRRRSPTSATAAPAPAVTAPAAAPAVEAVQADTAERTITVDNGVVRAVFSNRGATLVGVGAARPIWGRTASRSISFRTTFQRISRSRSR